MRYGSATAVAPFLLLLVASSLSSSSLALTPREAKSMTINVKIKSGASFQSTTINPHEPYASRTPPPFHVNSAICNFHYYPRETSSLSQRIVTVNMTGPMAITQQQQNDYMFDESNSLELEWHHFPSRKHLKFEFNAQVETYNAAMDTTTPRPPFKQYKLPFPITNLKQVLFDYKKRQALNREYLGIGQIANQSLQIQALARALVVGEDGGDSLFVKDWYQAVFRLADYCVMNIKCMENENDGNDMLFGVANNKKNKNDNLQTASQVLERKCGTCEELTALFVSLNRAVGIPARFVHGFTHHSVATTDTSSTDTPYKNVNINKQKWTLEGQLMKRLEQDSPPHIIDEDEDDEDDDYFGDDDDDEMTDEWRPHTWAEIWFPGDTLSCWIPFDIAANEFGYLNCGTIQMGTSDDAPSLTDPNTLVDFHSYHDGKDGAGAAALNVNLVAKPLITSITYDKKQLREQSADSVGGTTSPFLSLDDDANIEMSLDVSEAFLSTRNRRRARNSNHHGGNSEDDLGFDSEIVFVATIQNWNQHYVETELHMKVDDRMSLITKDNDANTKKGASPEIKKSNKILLSPQEIRTVEFKVQVHRDRIDCNGQDSYELPVQLYSRFEMLEAESKLIVEPKGKSRQQGVGGRGGGFSSTGSAFSHYDSFTKKEDYQVRLDGPVSLRPTFNNFLER